MGYPLILYHSYTPWLTSSTSDYLENIEQEIEPIPENNRLLIPKINVNMIISEGTTKKTLDKGAWRKGDSAIPGENGNIVISGHRYRFRPPSKKTFYLLNKLESDDYIYIFWEGQKHTYQVKKKYEVIPEKIEILEKGQVEKLTLFTCTPLFFKTRRLVIEAIPAP